jgi:RecA-family ATPase
LCSPRCAVDPRDEIERRVIATCLHHDLDPGEIAGRLFIDSGRQTPIKIGEAQNGKVTIATPVVDALVEAIRDLGVDVLIIDPFVSVHSLPENDNGAMDAAVKAFALVADRTGCAIDLVHHARKLNGVDADIDAARGGSAHCRGRTGCAGAQRDEQPSRRGIRHCRG